MKTFQFLSYEDEEYLEEEQEADEQNFPVLCPDPVMTSEGNSGMSSVNFTSNQQGLWLISDEEDIDEERRDDSYGNMDESSGKDFVFTYTGIFCRRPYRSQQRQKQTTRAIVNGNSVNEVLESIWSHAKKAYRPPGYLRQ